MSEPASITTDSDFLFKSVPPFPLSRACGVWWRAVARRPPWLPPVSPNLDAVPSSALPPLLQL